MTYSLNELNWIFQNEGLSPYPMLRLIDMIECTRDAETQLNKKFPILHKPEIIEDWIERMEQVLKVRESATHYLIPYLN